MTHESTIPPTTSPLFRNHLIPSKTHTDVYHIDAFRMCNILKFTQTV